MHYNSTAKVKINSSFGSSDTKRLPIYIRLISMQFSFCPSDFHHLWKL